MLVQSIRDPRVKREMSLFKKNGQLRLRSKSGIIKGGEWILSDPCAQESHLSKINGDV